MKVGLYLTSMDPDSGGGYTFETEILKALLRSKSTSAHTFTLLGWKEQPPAEYRDASIEYVCLSLSPAERLELKRKQYNRVIDSQWKKIRYPGLRAKPARTDAFEELIVRKLIRQKIQFLCYLAPTSRLTMELPYLTVVWDLQHRLQPFFPEVSIQGEWSRREDYFKTYLRRASFVIAGTSAGREELKTFFQVPIERIKIIPHPTPDFMHQSNSTEEVSVLEKYKIPQNFILYPAQFWPHKNHILILEALHLLRKNHDISLHAVFAGSDKGNEPYIRKKTTELGLDGQVHFLGFVSQSELRALYQHALALTYVSLFGPENLPPLEAFAIGCSVIASDVSGAREQLGDAALLVHPTQEQELVQAILRLQNDPSLVANLKAAGFQRSKERTCDRFIQNIFSILDEFASVRRCWD